MTAPSAGALSCWNTNVSSVMRHFLHHISEANSVSKVNAQGYQGYRCVLIVYAKYSSIFGAFFPGTLCSDIRHVSKKTCQHIFGSVLVKYEPISFKLSRYILEETFNKLCKNCPVHLKYVQALFWEIMK